MCDELYMTEENFVIGCLHLANLCSGYVILVQFDQIQEIGGKASITEKILCALQKVK